VSLISRLVSNDIDGCRRKFLRQRIGTTWFGASFKHAQYRAAKRFLIANRALERHHSMGSDRPASQVISSRNLARLVPPVGHELRRGAKQRCLSWREVLVDARNGVEQIVFDLVVQPAADGRLFLFTLTCAGRLNTVFLLPFLAAQFPGYEHVGQALRLCLSFLVKIKAVPARTCTARELGLDPGELTLNTKGAVFMGVGPLARSVCPVASNPAGDLVHAGFELL
jgi:hypothetical protein